MAASSRRNQTNKSQTKHSPSKHTESVDNKGDGAYSDKKTNNRDNIKCKFNDEMSIDKKTWWTTKRVAIITIIINAVLAIGTFLLFNEAHRGNKAAFKADSIAQASLNMSKTHYEVENAPILAIIKFDSFVFRHNYLPTFNYELTNLGKQTIKIKGSYIALGYDTLEVDTPAIKGLMEQKVFQTDYGSYIVNGRNVTHDFPLFPSPIQNGEILFKNKKINVFFFARYTYINYTNSKTRQYTCLVKIKNESLNDKVKLIYRFMINDNVDL